MASSQISRLKAQLEAKTKAAAAAGSANAENTPASASTPDDIIHGHFQKARTQAERERIQIETAKKMAARFNLTYRALALSAAKKTAEHRLRDIQAAKDAKERAAKYQMTARSLQMSSTGTSSGRVNVLSFHDDSTSTVTGGGDDDDDEDDGATRYSQAYTLDDDHLSQYCDDEGEFRIQRKFTQLGDLETPPDDDEGGENAPPSAAHGGGLEDAVREFLQAHDESRLGEVDALVAQFFGREEALLAELHAQYPSSE